MKDRADRLLVEQGLTESRQRAQALIMAGRVYVDGQRIEKAGQLLPIETRLSLKERLPFVSRGGIKLDSALQHFALDVRDAIAADLGASTGGFTDCLLQSGAQKVYAVDVDPRQLDWRLQNDPRVVVIKKNARHLAPDDIAEPVGLITMDLSFISVLKVLPALNRVGGQGRVIALIKPQFEVGRGRVGKKGIVRDPAQHRQALQHVIGEAEALGFGVAGITRSPILGQKGNREFFILWIRGPSPLSPDEIETLIREAVENETH
jgi:23S rRNA (cytidine1920-2'-O)/16S rRNA (cytidine1409-2'-O)-methyltransferase